MISPAGYGDQKKEGGSVFNVNATLKPNISV